MPDELRFAAAGDFGRALIRDEVIVAFSVGPSGEAIALAVADDAVATPFARDVQPGWASFPKAATDKPYDAALLVHDGSTIDRSDLRGLETAFPLVQLLPNDELLLAGARSRYRNDAPDQNGRVYGRHGELRREFVLGDGIEDVQATSDGRIWVSYGDEGVFGNYGWGEPGGAPPIGASGLVRFDSHGTVQWEYRPPQHVDGIAHCYALNVEDDATWIYYYESFPLVRIARDGAVRAWDTRFNAGAHALAVAPPVLVFYGGHMDEEGRLIVCKLVGDRVEQVARADTVVPRARDGKRATNVVGRGPQLHALVENIWYRLDVRDLRD